jgi:hypothetical protein
MFSEVVHTHHPSARSGIGDHSHCLRSGLDSRCIKSFSRIEVISNEMLRTSRWRRLLSNNLHFDESKNLGTASNHLNLSSDPQYDTGSIITISFRLTLWSEESYPIGCGFFTVRGMESEWFGGRALLVISRWSRGSNHVHRSFGVNPSRNDHSLSGYTSSIEQETIGFLISTRENPIMLGFNCHSLCSWRAHGGDSRLKTSLGWICVSKNVTKHTIYSNANSNHIRCDLISEPMNRESSSYITIKGENK